MCRGMLYSEDFRICVYAAKCGYVHMFSVVQGVLPASAHPLGIGLPTSPRGPNRTNYYTISRQFLEESRKLSVKNRLKQR